MNGGLPCHSDLQRKDDFAEKEQEECEHKERCPEQIYGQWTNFGGLSECSVACGGGSQRRTRQCIFPPFPDFRPGFDQKIQCPGSSVYIIDDPPCNPQSCSISTLFFLIDTTGSFHGPHDQNLALTIGAEIVKELIVQGVEVPRFQITKVGDPDVEVGAPIIDARSFNESLFNIHRDVKGRLQGDGTWPERSTKGLLETARMATAGAVLCLFTDAATHDHDLEADIQNIVRNKGLSIYIFLTADYPIDPNENRGNYANPQLGIPSFKLYQRLSKRHTYIMSKTDPSSASLVIEKALKKSTEGKQYQ